MYYIVRTQNIPKTTPKHPFSWKVDNTNYCQGKLDPNWAKCLNSWQNFSRRGQKKLFIKISPSPPMWPCAFKVWAEYAKSPLKRWAADLVPPSLGFGIGRPAWASHWTQGAGGWGSGCLYYDEQPESAIPVAGKGSIKSIWGACRLVKLQVWNLAWSGALNWIPLAKIGPQPQGSTNQRIEKYLAWDSAESMQNIQSTFLPWCHDESLTIVRVSLLSPFVNF